MKYLKKNSLNVEYVSAYTFCRRLLVEVELNVSSEISPASVHSSGFFFATYTYKMLKLLFLSRRNISFEEKKAIA